MIVWHRSKKAEFSVLYDREPKIKHLKKGLILVPYPARQLRGPETEPKETGGIPTNQVDVYLGGEGRFPLFLNTSSSLDILVHMIWNKSCPQPRFQRKWGLPCVWERWPWLASDCTLTTVDSEGQ